MKKIFGCIKIFYIFVPLITIITLIQKETYAPKTVALPPRDVCDKPSVVGVFTKNQPTP